MEAYIFIVTIIFCAVSLCFATALFVLEMTRAINAAIFTFVVTLLTISFVLLSY